MRVSEKRNIFTQFGDIKQQDGSIDTNKKNL